MTTTSPRRASARTRATRGVLAVVAPVLGAAGFAVACTPEPAVCLNLLPTIVGTSGAETLNGTTGNDIIAGLGGNDTINGLGGNDTICGGGGLDTIDGGADRDVLEGGRDTDTVRGGTGVDTVTYQNGASGVVVDLQAGSGDGDALSDVESIVGTRSGDYLAGNGVARAGPRRLRQLVGHDGLRRPHHGEGRR